MPSHNEGKFGECCARRTARGRHRAARLAEVNQRLDAALALARRSRASKIRVIGETAPQVCAPQIGVPAAARLVARSDLDFGQMRQVMATIGALLDDPGVPAGHAPIEATAFSLGPLADCIRASHADLAHATAATLAVSVSGEFAERAGDAHSVEQILSNLMDNALGRSPGAEVAVSIDASAPDHIRISVHEGGHGRPSGQADALVAGFGGRRLGLSIVRRLVALMQGEFRMEIAEGSGARFDVTLPLAAPARVAAEPPL